MLHPGLGRHGEQQCLHPNAPPMSIIKTHSAPPAAQKSHSHLFRSYRWQKKTSQTIGSIETHRSWHAGSSPGCSQRTARAGAAVGPSDPIGSTGTQPCCPTAITQHRVTLGSWWGSLQTLNAACLPHNPPVPRGEARGGGDGGGCTAQL